MVAGSPLHRTGGWAGAWTEVFPETVPNVAEIVVVPVPVPAVANPALLMVATAVFEEAQVTSLVMSCVLLFE